MRRIGTLAAVATLIGVSACGPTTHVPTANVSVVTERAYPGPTGKEECLQSYVNCYRERDAEQLDALLAPDYYFHSAGWEEVMQRKQDLWSTTGLFDVCPILGLEIRNGEWTPAGDVRGEPCDDCWQTTRGYIFVYSTGDGTGLASVGHMRFVVRGTSEDGTIRYRMRAIEELEGGESQELVAPE